MTPRSPRPRGGVLRACHCALAFAAGVLLASDSAAQPTLRVEGGGSIAAALEQAAPGSVIEVEPGLYHEALTVDTPGITLRGIVEGDQRPVLDGGGTLNDAVIASGSPFTMSGFEVRHYRGNGVSTQGVDGVLITDLVVDDTGLYGIYPVNSTNVVVTHCTLTGIRDAAIYVGESRGALVAYNEVHGNVAGIEIENTNDAEVRDNLAWDNTTGILVFVLPLKLQKEGRRTRIHRNWSVRNNRPNFGDPESIVGGLPHGGGILVMGADDTVVENNQVKENESFGIGVVRLPPDQAARDPELEPLSDRTRIAPNYLEGNGTRPHPFVRENFGGGADIAFDGTGVGNCIDVPRGAVYRGPDVPACAVARATRAPSPPDRAPAHKPAVVPRAAEPDRSAAAADGEVVVHIRGMRYHPKHVEVGIGDTVRWVNDDAVPHTVTSSRGMQILRDPLDSPFLLQGDSYRHTFARAGSFEYLCLPHMDQAPMRGATVSVQ